MSNILSPYVFNGGPWNDLGGGSYGTAPFEGIMSVSGTVSDGQVLTITGGGFGSGCSSVWFEDYSDGVLNSDIKLDNTVFNVTGDGTGTFAKRVSDSRSGSLAASVFQETLAGGQWVSHGLHRTFSAVTELFVSQAVKIPSGSRFPGTGGGTSGTNADYSSDSSWKTVWVTGGSTGTNDIVIPSHIGVGVWSHIGNDLPDKRNWGADPTWWEWGAWNRLTTWMKAGDTPEVDAGQLYFQVANTADTLFEDSTTPVIFSGGTNPYNWTDVRVGGWIKDTATQNDVVVLYDDIYIAAGDNAAARVELGNNAVYENCTDLAVCDHNTWADGSLSVNCREGGLNLSANTWLFVTTADNTTRYSTQVVTV